MSGQDLSHVDMRGDPVVLGDRIQMPGVPFVVTVDKLVECDSGCNHGAAEIVDPESGERDTVCLHHFVVVR